MSFLKNLFSSKDSPISEIGNPTNVVHGIHVQRNKETGDLEGLPPQWKTFLDTQLTQAEQTQNPNAVYQALKLFQYSIKPKKENEAFKPIITEDVITEESKEIDEYVKIKIQNKESKNSSLSSEDDIKETFINPPPLPEKPGRVTKPIIKPKPTVLNKKTTVHIKKEETQKSTKRKKSASEKSENEAEKVKKPRKTNKKEKKIEENGESEPTKTRQMRKRKTQKDENVEGDEKEEMHVKVPRIPNTKAPIPQRVVDQRKAEEVKQKAIEIFKAKKATAKK